jgi:hypothetical protein
MYIYIYIYMCSVGHMILKGNVCEAHAAGHREWDVGASRTNSLAWHLVFCRQNPIPSAVVGGHCEFRVQP